MDQANIVILSVKAGQSPFLTIEASDGFIYKADMSKFKAVYCFPKTQKEWEDVSVSAFGYNLTWGSRFEVHSLQVIDQAVSKEAVKKQA